MRKEAYRMEGTPVYRSHRKYVVQMVAEIDAYDLEDAHIKADMLQSEVEEITHIDWEVEYVY